MKILFLFATIAGSQLPAKSRQFLPYLVRPTQNLYSLPYKRKVYKWQINHIKTAKNPKHTLQDTFRRSEILLQDKPF